MVAPTHPEIDVRPAGTQEQKLTAAKRFDVPAPRAVEPEKAPASVTPQAGDPSSWSSIALALLVIATFALIVWLAAQGTPADYDPTYDYFLH